MGTQQENLTAIAEAIREKEGTTEPIVANEFAGRIQAISTGLTQEEADERYVQKIGDQAIEGSLNVKAYLRSGGGVETGHNGIYIQEEVDPYNYSRINPGTFEMYIADQNYNPASLFGSLQVYTDYETGMSGSELNITDTSWGNLIISGLGTPLAYDHAANKGYVDRKAAEVSDECVKKKGKVSQTIEGYISLMPPGDIGEGAMVAYEKQSNGTASSELHPRALYFEFWHNDGREDYGIQIFPTARGMEDSEETGVWIPALEFIDFSGLKEDTWVVLSGVNTPTEDYDAANKKYVDEAVAVLTARIAQLEAQLQQAQTEEATT